MKYYTRIGDRERSFTFTREDGVLIATTEDAVYHLDLAMVGDGTAFSLLVDHRSHDLIVDQADGKTNILVNGETVQVQVEDERERTAQAVAGSRPKGKRTITASLPCVEVEVPIAVGDVVEDGQTVVLLEAMKMQNPIQAEGGGTEVEVHVAPGQAIGAGAPLVELDG